MKFSENFKCLPFVNIYIRCIASDDVVRTEWLCFLLIVWKRSVLNTLILGISGIGLSKVRQLEGSNLPLFPNVSHFWYRSDCEFPICTFLSYLHTKKIMSQDPFWSKVISLIPGLLNTCDKLGPFRKLSISPSSSYSFLLYAFEVVKPLMSILSICRLVCENTQLHQEFPLVSSKMPKSR